MKILILTVLLCAFLAVSCGSGGGGSTANSPAPGDQTSEGDPTATNDAVTQALAQSGDSLANTFGQTLMTCGAQSHNTTPDDWGEVAIDGGNTLCAVWTPPFWTNARAGLVNVVYNQQDDANSVTLAGGTPWDALVCTPTGVGDWALQKISDSGCANATRVWSEALVFDIVGIQIPAEILVVTCERNGATQAGAYVSQVHGTSPLCTLRFDGYMTRQDQIGQAVCTLSQIVNSLKCLEEGQNDFKCTKPECSQAMKAQGHLGGFCNSFDECIPVD